MARASTTACSACWYGKGPGVDRTGDVFKHANLAGTSQLGGVLVLMGDDHTCESSTTRAPARVRLRRRHDPGAQPGGRAGDPRLRPARLRPVPLLRAAGSASSASHDTVETAAVGRARSDRVGSGSPPDSRCRRAASTSAGRDPPLAQEARLHELQARRRRWPSPAPTGSTGSIFDSPRPRGSASSPPARSYLDVRQALDDLGIDEALAGRLGRPASEGRHDLAARAARASLAFARRPGADPRGRGEARADREPAQGAALRLARDARPRVIGKCDESGE